jgi:hypothetical protein
LFLVALAVNARLLVGVSTTEVTGRKLLAARPVLKSNAYLNLAGFGFALTARAQSILAHPP